MRTFREVKPVVVPHLPPSLVGAPPLLAAPVSPTLSYHAA